MSQADKIILVGGGNGRQRGASHQALVERPMERAGLNQKSDRPRGEAARGTRDNMKALIIYDSITSALKASNTLRNALFRTEITVDLKINVWGVSLLRIPAVANEALKMNLDADLLVFASPRAFLTPSWLKEWLERWAAGRLVENAAVALISDESPCAPISTKASGVYKFAARHNLHFIVSDGGKHIYELISSFVGGADRIRMPVRNQ